MFSRRMVGASSRSRKAWCLSLRVICLMMVWIRVAMMGEYAISYRGWFTMEIMEGWSGWLMSRFTSSADRAIKIRWVLIFFRALERVPNMAAVCRSDPLPAIKALAMALAV